MTKKPRKPAAKRKPAKPGKTRSTNKPSRKTPKRNGKGNGQGGTPWHRTKSRHPAPKKPTGHRIRVR